MDKMAIARRKCARGAVLTLLFGNPRAAVMQRTLEYALMQDDPQAANEIGSHIYYLADTGYVKCYLGDEVLSLVQDPPREALVRLTAKGIDLMEGTLDDEGVPCYEIKEGVAWDNIPFTDELKRLALSTRAVCFGSLAQRNDVSRATINRFLDTMPDIDGQLKIFDINLRQDFYSKEVLRESFRRCNVLKINDEELVTISRMFGYPGIDLQDKCWILLAKYNLKMLILTCGINGSYVFTPGVVSFQETPKVPVADTVGAGDSFTAAFCASILNGKPVPEAHKLAVEVSAYVCTQSGAMPELPQVLKDRLM